MIIALPAVRPEESPMKTIPSKVYICGAGLAVTPDVGVDTADLPGRPEEKAPDCVPIVAGALP